MKSLILVITKISAMAIIAIIALSSPGCALPWEADPDRYKKWEAERKLKQERIAEAREKLEKMKKDFLSVESKAENLWKHFQIRSYSDEFKGVSEKFLFGPELSHNKSFFSKGIEDSPSTLYIRIKWGKEAETEEVRKFYFENISSSMSTGDRVIRSEVAGFNASSRDASTITSCYITTPGH
jgi:hypothetical protein